MLTLSSRRLRLLGALALAAWFTPQVSSAQGAAPASFSAATQTAQQAPACKSLGDFYWEIGDARGVLGSGSIGSSYGPDRASRWPPPPSGCSAPTSAEDRAHTPPAAPNRWPVEWEKSRYTEKKKDGKHDCTKRPVSSFNPVAQNASSARPMR